VTPNIIDLRRPNLFANQLAKGIVTAVAIKFASKGWNVAISARRENLLREISDNNENIHGFPLDVTDKSKCKEVFEQIKNKFQSVDICFLVLEMSVISVEELNFSWHFSTLFFTSAILVQTITAS